MKRKILIVVAIAGIIISSLIWAKEYDEAISWDENGLPMSETLVYFLWVVSFSILLYFQLRKPEPSLKERVEKLEEEIKVLEENRLNN